MSNLHFSDGTKRILRDHPALPGGRTRELAADFVAAQHEVCRQLAALAYPLERIALELKAGGLSYFREGSDQDRKRPAAKKSSYRFAGFTAGHMAEFEERLTMRRAGFLDEAGFRGWQADFLMRFTFEVIEQVALRVSPPPGPAAGEPGTKRLRWQLADALHEARRLRDEILTGNLLLAAEIAMRRTRCYPILPADDLFSAGTDGLLIAINRYDPAVGNFSTYATPWIKMAVDRNAAKTRHVIHVPIGLQDKARRFRRAQEGGPDAAEPAVSIPQVQSLEEPLPGLADGELRLEDVVADPAASLPADAVEQADIAHILGEGVGKLDILKRLIIALRSDLGDAAELGAAFFREEAALSLARGRATFTAATRSIEEPAYIRLVSPSSGEPEDAREEPVLPELAHAI